MADIDPAGLGFPQGLGINKMLHYLFYSWEGWGDEWELEGFSAVPHVCVLKKRDTLES